MEEKNELMTKEVNELQAGIFNDNRVKKATTLDLNNEDDVDMLLNGMQECDFKLNDCINQELEIVGCYMTESLADSVNLETGEAVQTKKHVLMLFDADGKSYVTASNSCFLSFMNIVTLKGMPNKEHHLFLKPIKANAKEAGHFYLKLKLVKK